MKIKTFIDNSNGIFTASSYGFWFRYDLENTQSKYKPQFGDQVFYQYAVKNLNGNYIYSPNETEEKSYYMEQQDLLPGLREGLKLMKRGEKMTFIEQIPNTCMVMGLLSAKGSKINLLEGYL